MRQQLAGLGYSVEWKLVNASDFGVSQLRPRVVLVALRDDIKKDVTGQCLRPNTLFGARTTL